MVDRDEVQGEVDAAGDARRRGEPAVGDVEDVGHHLDRGVAAGEGLRDFVVGGGASSVEQACFSEGERAGTHAHDAAAAVVVLDEPPEQRRWEAAAGCAVADVVPADQHDVLGAEVGPRRVDTDLHSLVAGNPSAFSDIARPVGRADVDGAGEHLRGTGEVQQVDPDRDHEDDAAHDLVRSSR